MIKQIGHQYTISLDIPAGLKYLQVIGSCLDSMLAQVADLKDHDLFSHNVQLAVQEICTNIVYHAYQERENERIYIHITLEEQPQRLVVELIDKGIAFDESKVKEPNLDEGQVHGYGLFIAKNLMDKLIYRRQLDENFWCLIKDL
jgi:serine/threonine-protein kinase RsbW